MHVEKVNKPQNNRKSLEALVVLEYTMYDGPEVSKSIFKFFGFPSKMFGFLPIFLVFFKKNFLVSFQYFWFPSKILFQFPVKIFGFLPKFTFGFPSKNFDFFQFSSETFILVSFQSFYFSFLLDNFFDLEEIKHLALMNKWSHCLHQQFHSKKAQLFFSM